MGVEIDPVDAPDRAVRIVGDHTDAEVPAACDGYGAGLGLGADGQEGLLPHAVDGNGLLHPLFGGGAAA